MDEQENSEAVLRIDKRFIVSLKNKLYPTWPGVLDLAHRSGLRSIEVNLLQYPAPENGGLAIAQATATFDGERVYSEIGDCSAANCTPMIAVHACRMAATRAKGRALRDALNVGEALLEELGPDGPVDQPQRAYTAPRARHDPEHHAARKAVETAPEAVGPFVCAVCQVEVPAPVAKASMKRFAETLCVEHGKERMARRAEAQGQKAAASGYVSEARIDELEVNARADREGAGRAVAALIEGARAEAEANR